MLKRNKKRGKKKENIVPAQSPRSCVGHWWEGAGTDPGLE